MWLRFWVVCLTLPLIGQALGQRGTTTRVSVSSEGIQGNDDSEFCSISAEGRFAVFQSYASNLVLGDTYVRDVYVYDRVTGQTSRVSVSSNGVPGNRGSDAGSISADGRFVAFLSEASNLVTGDTNGFFDIFVHDRATGQTDRVSVSSAGTQGNGECGRFPSISRDGRMVAFISSASNLVPGDTNGVSDVFVHDRFMGQTTRVSVSSTGIQANGPCMELSLSGDGRCVAFVSRATNFVQGDTSQWDVFVHDRDTGQTARVSVNSSGVPGYMESRNPDLSADGRFVTFSSASNLDQGDTGNINDVWVHDRLTGETSIASVSSEGVRGNGNSEGATISANGRFVSFWGQASNLVPGDTNDYGDAFVHDRTIGQTVRVSVSSAATEGNNASASPVISADGRSVVFYTIASNLVPDDTNSRRDVLVHQYGSAIASGEMHLLDREPGTEVGELAMVEIRNVNSLVPLHSVLVTLGPGGTFSFDLPDNLLPGTYNLAAKHSNHLRLVWPSAFMTGPGVSGLVFDLPNGDSDDDNEIGIGDYALLSLAFNSAPGDPNWNITADLNGDDMVDIGDYAILSQNYGLVGDP